jgi:hypothetical protein
MSLPISSSTNSSPNNVKIQRMGNSNILVCDEAADSIEYQWGLINKITKKETDLANGKLRYIQLLNPFDTSTNIYWVKTNYIGNEDCFTKSYFNYSIPVSIKTVSKDEKFVSVFPNPNSGKFSVISNKDFLKPVLFGIEIGRSSCRERV